MYLIDFEHKMGENIFSLLQTALFLNLKYGMYNVYNRSGALGEFPFAFECIFGPLVGLDNNPIKQIT